MSTFPCRNFQNGYNVSTVVYIIKTGISITTAYTEFCENIHINFLQAFFIFRKELTKLDPEILWIVLFNNSKLNKLYELTVKIIQTKNTQWNGLVEIKYRQIHFIIGAIDNSILNVYTLLWKKLNMISFM